MPRKGAKDSLIFYESLLPPCNFVRTANILVGKEEYLYRAMTPKNTAS